MYLKNLCISIFEIRASHSLAERDHRQKDSTARVSFWITMSYYFKISHNYLDCTIWCYPLKKTAPLEEYKAGEVKEGCREQDLLLSSHICLSRNDEFIYLSTDTHLTDYKYTESGVPVRDMQDDMDPFVEISSLRHQFANITISLLSVHISHFFQYWVGARLYRCSKRTSPGLRNETFVSFRKLFPLPPSTQHPLHRQHRQHRQHLQHPQHRQSRLLTSVSNLSSLSRKEKSDHLKRACRSEIGKLDSRYFDFQPVG